VAALGLAPALSGCLNVSWEARKTGSPAGVLASVQLEPGRTTLPETLALLGPPDLLLRDGPIDRLYYVAWESDYVKLIFSAPVGPSQRSVDAFIMAFGSEELRMARLEFDRAGILRYLQRGDFGLSRDGQSVALDNRIVENFLEDRERALTLMEPDDDDDDEPVKPAKK
jgi:hypothetical protein